MGVSMRRLLLAVIALVGLQVPGAHAIGVEPTDFDLTIVCPGCALDSISLPSNPILLETTFVESESGYNLYSIFGGSVTVLSSDGFDGNDNYLYYPGYPANGGAPFDNAGLSFSFNSGDYNLFCDVGPACFIYYATISDPQTLSATFVVNAATTPLPAALPLFATGLGGLGLLGWRRKRKNTAAIAAA
jgi:hypothetical protein